MTSSSRLQKRNGETIVSSSAVTEEEYTIANDGVKSNKKLVKIIGRFTRQLITITHWDDLPDWQKDNEHIHEGYVKETNSFINCFESLFFLHNESVNIYSHMVPGLCALFMLLIDINIIKKFPTTTFVDYFMIDLFLAGAFSCLILSSAFHTLKSHSLFVAIYGNKLDYLGIVILIVTSMISILYYGFYDTPYFFHLFSTITILFGIACGTVSLANKFRSREWRPYRATLFVCFGLSAVFPVLTGIWYYGLEDTFKRIQLKWIVTEGFFYIFGAFLYAMRYPERICPGAFDLWGHSHQIFHVFVVIAAYSHFHGLLSAYEYAHEMLIK
ncbi:hypothetical protein TPHA_0M00290 [Tetrapisispora phaffii CBS 4417]|uniref:Uncharacterized protein n=1 Tax=Tetrapisispora phaffii (strain ATCC 24235 / CBS 4417 / NBRC 1672 / NRRL Y-8282 / UCD 70-5) TaxID=1071381 RepID=G8C0U5_TETPH|nr:hypothetical protein TPHA_0M00290 [Tetrapisispora phaffii CBS 4417]CCE65606.1 hypothetical protein TPHA_0M00290 [Tetrapisispora phaffii CBS 4417]